MEYYFQRYGDVELHRRMISDQRRTDAFAAGIAKVVKKGDVVIDVGTGTGILAMLAARAGAKRVYAIDQAEIAQTAANMVKANGLSRKVKILRGMAAELKVDEKADVIVSEWLGNFAFVEGMLDDLLAVRDASLGRGGKMIPGRVALILAPIDDGVLYNTDGPGGWRRTVHGLDLTSLEESELHQGRATQLRIEPGALLAEGEVLVDVDMAKATSQSPFQKGQVEFTATRDGVLNGFCGWFTAELAKDVVLDTGPHFPVTHWAQTYLPFQPKFVKKGARIVVDYALTPDPEERRYLDMTLKVGRRKQRFHLE